MNAEQTACPICGGPCKRITVVEGYTLGTPEYESLVKGEVAAEVETRAFIGDSGDVILIDPILDKGGGHGHDEKVRVLVIRAKEKDR